MTQDALSALDAWFLTPQGEAVAEAFTATLVQLPDLLSKMQGEACLQIGKAGACTWLDLFHYRQKWVVSSTIARTGTHSIDVLALPKKMPFDQSSIDCVLLPLILEMTPWTMHPLDEIDRLLKPMGYAVIFSINAWSLWGLCMKLHQLTCYGERPGYPHSIVRLKHAFIHRGYQILELSPFYYIPPIQQKWYIQKLEILNELGKMISPCPGGFYCLIVQKYRPSLLPIVKKTKNWQYAPDSSGLQPV